MQKKCFPILLPTDGNGHLSLIARGTKLFYFNDVERGINKQHLYICSIDGIKEGEQCMYQNGDGTGGLKSWIAPFVANSAGAKYKIIATTDSSLHCSGLRREGASCEKNNNCTYPICGGAIAKIPQAFIHSYIEMYNKGEQLKEVMVEYQPCGVFGEEERHDFPRLNGNEIIITNKKESWTKDEVEAIKRDAFAKGQEVESLLRRGFAAEGLRIKFDFFKDI